MKNFMKGYSKWKSNISAGKLRMMHKFLINAMILCQQKKQKERHDFLKETRPDNQWVQSIDDVIGEYECKDLEEFIKGL